MEPPWLHKDAKSDPLGDQMLPLWEPAGATGEPKRHEASKNVPKATKNTKKHDKWGDTWLVLQESPRGMKPQKTSPR